eukprot:6584171-Pyramimonas_sp.AAC.1
MQPIKAGMCGRSCSRPLPFTTCDEVNSGAEEANSPLDAAAVVEDKVNSGVEEVSSGAEEAN